MRKRPAPPADPYVTAYQRWRAFSQSLADQDLLAQSAAALSLLAGRLSAAEYGRDAYYAANRALHEIDQVRAMVAPQEGAA